MKICFYQIPKLFIDNSSYLGELIELEQKEVNTNLANVSSINLLLDELCQDYNYIKVEKNENDYYYYFLESYTYYNALKLNFKYKIDIIRTLKEKDLLNHDVNIQRYSNVLEMADAQKIYFWNHQDIKLGATIVQDYKNNYVPYSDNLDIQEVWKNNKWLYIWLQPRTNQTANGIVHQYSFTKQIKENIITVALESSLALNTKIYKGSPSYPTYPENQAYYATDTQKYYRCVMGKEIFKYPYVIYKILEPLKDFNYTTTTYYLHKIPTVKVNNVPNSLYCLAIPLNEVIVLRDYYDAEVQKQKSLSWSADNLIPYLFDVEAANNWNDYIVDIKVSMIPPVELISSKYNFSTFVNAAGHVKPAIRIPASIPGSDFTPITNLSDNTIRTEGVNTITSEIFLPFLKTKLIELTKLASTFILPEINKQNVVQKKFYLCTVEERKELDIVALAANNANILYYYEDIFPGRTNVLYGFAPAYDTNEDILYYLMHSPSTIFFDRDTSLPVFTSNYQSYISNNKNFVQQAQLQRNSELTQSLVSASASAGGAVTVSQLMPGFSPAAALASSGAKIANAAITYAVQKKQFDWSVENMKAAPGNYKAAAATLSLMLSLDLYNLWSEQYNANDFDISVYDELINDVGYEYFNFRYNLTQIIDNTFINANEKKYLQANLTGLTNNVKINLALINILYQQLREGVNIFI